MYKSHTMQQSKFLINLEGPMLQSSLLFIILWLWCFCTTAYKLVFFSHGFFDIQSYFWSDFPVNVKVSKQNDVKEGVEVILHAVSVLELSVDEWSVHIPAILLPKIIILVKVHSTVRKLWQRKSSSIKELSQSFSQDSSHLFIHDLFNNAFNSTN